MREETKRDKIKRQTGATDEDIDDATNDEITGLHERIASLATTLKDDRAAHTQTLRIRDEQIAALEAQLTTEKERADSNFASCERIKEKLSATHNDVREVRAEYGEFIVKSGQQIQSLSAALKLSEDRIRSLNTELNHSVSYEGKLEYEKEIEEQEQRILALEKALRSAPHDSGCSIQARHLTSIQTGGETILCRCWKPKAESLLSQSSPQTASREGQ